MGPPRESKSWMQFWTNYCTPKGRYITRDERATKRDIVKGTGKTRNEGMGNEETEIGNGLV